MPITAVRLSPLLLDDVPETFPSIRQHWRSRLLVRSRPVVAARKIDSHVPLRARTMSALAVGGPSVMLIRLLLGMLAGLVAVGTAILVLAAGRAFDLEQIFTGGPLTPGGAAGLFGLVVIVVGASAAEYWLVRRIVRKPGRENA